MADVTHILNQIEQGDSNASEQLLPLVYDELRRLAAARMARESPDHTLQATALVHDAYVRLVDGQHDQHWDSRVHFFSAAAEAMRRILVESARRKQSIKQGGQLERQALIDSQIELPGPSEKMLAVNEALDELEKHDPEAALLVKLRYFSGFTHQQAAEAMGITRRSADRRWTLARAWLFQQLAEN